MGVADALIEKCSIHCGDTGVGQCVVSEKVPLKTVSYVFSCLGGAARSKDVGLDLPFQWQWVLGLEWIDIVVVGGGGRIRVMVGKGYLRVVVEVVGVSHESFLGDGLDQAHHSLEFFESLDAHVGHDAGKVSQFVASPIIKVLGRHPHHRVAGLDSCQDGDSHDDPQAQCRNCPKRHKELRPERSLLKTRQEKPEGQVHRKGAAVSQSLFSVG